MSNLSQFFGGSVPSAVVSTTTHTMFGSGTYLARMPGTYAILAIGGGGSGAVSMNSVGNTMSLASGGGSSPIGIKIVKLSASTNLTVTVGAGGAAVNPAVNNGSNGNAGGTTTVVGTGVNISVPGGNGGVHVRNVTTGSTNLAGPTAVTTASGVDFVYPGSTAGTLTGPATITSVTCAASGGASINFGFYGRDGSSFSGSVANGGTSLGTAALSSIPTDQYLGLQNPVLAMFDYAQLVSLNASFIASNGVASPVTATGINSGGYGCASGGAASGTSGSASGGAGGPGLVLIKYLG